MLDVQDPFSKLKKQHINLIKIKCYKNLIKSSNKKLITSTKSS